MDNSAIQISPTKSILPQDVQNSHYVPVIEHGYEPGQTEESNRDGSRLEISMNDGSYLTAYGARATVARDRLFEHGKVH